MKKAVLCFAHKSPEQVNVLIRQLLFDTNGNTDIFIHFDKKNEELAETIIRGEHVFLIKNNVNVTWGDDSMVKAFINSIHEIISIGKEYDYFVVCTGQDLLVHSGLDDFLSRNIGKIFIDSWDNSINAKIFLTHYFPKFMCKYIPKRGNIIRIIRSLYIRVLKTGIIPKRKIGFDYSKWVFWTSYNWSAMPFDVIKYIKTFFCENPNAIKLFQNTFLPEDGFLATIIMNSPYKECVEFIDSSRTRSLTYISEMINQHCQLLTMDSITDISKSKCFFARKFDIELDSDVVYYYEKKILGE